MARIICHEIVLSNEWVTGIVHCTFLVVKMISVNRFLIDFMLVILMTNLIFFAVGA